MTSSRSSRASQGDKYFLQSTLDIEEILQIILSNPVHFLILQTRKSRMIREGEVTFLRSQSFYTSFLSIFPVQGIILRQNSGTWDPLLQCDNLDTPLLELQSMKKIYGIKNNCVHVQLEQILDQKSCLTLQPMDCNLPASSVHGIFQARTLEWGALPISRRSSQPRDWTQVSCSSCTGRQILYYCVTWQAYKLERQN